MKKIRIKKGYVAGALALILAVLGPQLTTVRAAEPLNFGNACSLTIETTGNEYAKELAGVPEIPVKLYKVASMEETADYTVDKKYGDDFVIEDKGDDKAAWAKMWRELAAKAVGKIEAPGSTIREQVTLAMHPVTEAGRTISKATARNLAPGLYLVMASTVQHKGYEYSFTPYLISVPNNAYRMVSSSGREEDKWIYDVTVGLKPARRPLEGEMEIQKTLNTFNESLGEVTFIFEVTGRDPVTNEIIYNNVISMNFDSKTPNGTQSVKITGLPVGTIMTVKEIYNGGSYKELSGEYSTTIQGYEADASGKLVSQTKPVSVTNDYDDKLKKGYGIVNHFDFVGDQAGTDSNGNLVIKGHYEWEKWFKDSVDSEAETGPTGKGSVPENAK